MSREMRNLQQAPAATSRQRLAQPSNRLSITRNETKHMRHDEMFLIKFLSDATGHKAV